MRIAERVEEAGLEVGCFFFLVGGFFGFEKKALNLPLGVKSERSGGNAGVRGLFGL